MNRQFLSSCSPLLRDYIGALNASLDVAVIISVKRFNFFLGTLDCPIIHTVTRKDSDSAYSGERERPFWLNVNTFFLNASPTGVCTPGVHVQSIS